jgi:hypothetical protein
MPLSMRLSKEFGGDIQFGKCISTPILVLGPEKDVFAFRTLFRFTTLLYLQSNSFYTHILHTMYRNKEPTVANLEIVRSD